MLVIRPICAADFAALKQIAVESGHGFTSLPDNDELLLSKISRAQKSFTEQVTSPGQQNYLFVLEDTQSKEIIGVTGIEAAVGLNAPFYHYHIASHVHYSERLGVKKVVETLNLCNDYTGASEVCTLFVREKFRRGFAGQLLSRVRYLFMANHPERFSDLVIAEMRGVSDENGHSPFWAWLEPNFFGIDFPTADYLVGMGDKSFIAELMPKHPIYVALLSKDAQNVIGQVHEKTAPALRLLQKEGFFHRGYVDLFDAGPTVEVALKNIRTVQQSQLATVLITDKSQLPTTDSGAQNYMLCSTDVSQFRATITPCIRYENESNTLLISAEMASELGLMNASDVRFIGL
ncbi:arginine succinyltransferase [Paraglaciecola sp. T6c]|uniref:arginine N-succinyltransferase n=1 Tax=Pseudoalteromonas atlantica (strain T6c / ATCC BAA-1087) TaxID=3042615 RepID=UPI00005C5751|nr:arginine N-succinyltransferase [Paraglaciecola sp. T6c]ABG38696.1 arginine succinyltransferase [Paraglaciecola sp. T6c]